MKDNYIAVMTADWQLCNHLPYAKPSDQEGVTDRLLDQVRVVKEIANITTRARAHGIFFLGDYFEKRLLDAVTLRFGVELAIQLAELADFFVLPGNHDANSLSGNRFTPEVFAVIAHPKIRYLDGTLVTSPRPWLDFYSVPWCHLEIAQGKIEEARRKRVEGHTNILLLHHPILDCTDGGWRCDAGLDWGKICDGWDAVYAGHFHEAQKFGLNGKYVGAPMEHDQRDAGSAPRGVYVVTFAPGVVSEEFVPITSPRFHSVDWDEVKDGELDVGPGDYVRVGVSATHAEWVVRFAGVEAWAKGWRDHGVHIDIFHKPIYQNEQRLNIGERPSQENILARYVELADTTGLDPKRLLEIGRAILEEVRSNG